MATFILIAACVLVLAVDYPWGDLQNHAHSFIWVPLKASDVVLNFFLGVPMGVGAALVFRRAAVSAAMIAGPVSIAGEWMQIYSHSRFPSVSDVALNVLGAVAASIAVTSWKRKRLHV